MVLTDYMIYVHVESWQQLEGEKKRHTLSRAGVRYINIFKVIVVPCAAFNCGPALKRLDFADGYHSHPTQCSLFTSSSPRGPAWLLEELNVDYDLKFANRQSDGSVPKELHVPTAVGKSPAIQDGNFILGESGAITE